MVQGVPFFGKSTNFWVEVHVRVVEKMEPYPFFMGRRSFLVACTPQNSAFPLNFHLKPQKRDTLDLHGQPIRQLVRVWPSAGSLVACLQEARRRGNLGN